MNAEDLANLSPVDLLKRLRDQVDAAIAAIPEDTEWRPVAGRKPGAAPASLMCEIGDFEIRARFNDPPKGKTLCQVFQEEEAKQTTTP